MNYIQSYKYKYQNYFPTKQLLESAFAELCRGAKNDDIEYYWWHGIKVYQIPEETFVLSQCFFSFLEYSFVLFELIYLTPGKTIYTGLDQWHHKIFSLQVDK